MKPIINNYKYVCMYKTKKKKKEINLYLNLYVYDTKYSKSQIPYVKNV